LRALQIKAKADSQFFIGAVKYVGIASMN